jgi:PAS domain S-box-containing protein
MIKNIKEKQITTVTILAVEFVLFTSLIILLQRLTSDIEKSKLILGVCVLMATLLGAVWMTVQRHFRQIEKTVQKLTEDISAKSTTIDTIQTQFEEAIEKRVYELQVVNGALNREIAERTQAEEEIRELQKQLSLILDSAGEGIFGLDNQGNVTFMNNAASLMLGWEVEELLGKSHHKLVHHTHPDGSKHREEVCPIYMAYRDGVVHFKSNDVFWSKNNTSFPVEYISTPIRDRGMLTGAVVVFRDMTTFA